MSTTDKICSSSTVDIKKLLRENYFIVCDTNVFLGLYRNSPDYATFALECLQQVKKKILIPNTVRVEFTRHSRSMFSAHQKKIESVADDALKLVQHQNLKLQNAWKVLVAKNYPDADGCLEKIDAKYHELESLIKGYFEEHPVLELLRDDWDIDRADEFVRQCIENGQEMCPVSQARLYEICEEGERRYKNEIPPGFKDAKVKDGIRKYSDLIMWKEILQHAKVNQVNILFVTDDVKADWWKTEGSSPEFLPALVQEFVRETRLPTKQEDAEPPALQIIPFTSNDFFMSVSESYGIDVPDAVSQALKITLDDYIQKIENRVFEEIQDEIVCSEWKYVDSGILSAYGDEYVDDWEIESFDLESYSMEDRYEDEITYKLQYHVEMSGRSFAYWGRDDDTKEVILSPPYIHTVEGTITVLVRRTADLFTDFRDADDYDSVEILDSDLEETKCVSPYEEDDYPESYCPDSDNICPECGCKINTANGGGNGFCISCTPKK